MCAHTFSKTVMEMRCVCVFSVLKLKPASLLSCFWLSHAVLEVKHLEVHTHLLQFVVLGCSCKAPTTDVPPSCLSSLCCFVVLTRQSLLSSTSLSNHKPPSALSSVPAHSRFILGLAVLHFLPRFIRMLLFLYSPSSFFL